MSKRFLHAACLTATITCLLPAPEADAQQLTSERTLDLAADSPYHDPDLIYLESDELINDEDTQTLTARGSVEGRYQDRSLRADEVIYYRLDGRVIASGNVVLVNSDGSSQYAEKLEITSELGAGTASNFTSRLPNGGIMGAAFATRREDEGVDLFKAYYTACEPCKDKKTPTWQIKAKQVTQDTGRNAILYKDAVFELFGVPILYTPYLAHPDPSAERASGFLNPFGGLSSTRGAFIEIPYYVNLDDYSELTLTPHLFTKVNPLMELDYRRKFYSGELKVNGSFTYASAFDKNGDPFTDEDVFNRPLEATLGKRIRSHLFADGQFKLSDTWDWGFTAQAATDDLYLRRYGLSEPGRLGIYTGDSRRLISQIFGVGQSDSFRFAASAYGFQSLRTTIRQNEETGVYSISREDDSILPIIAPKIEFNHYLTDPIIGGRLETFGDFTMLTRKIGDDYQRGTAGVEWSKTFILPAGIEAKPFAEARYDHFNVTPYDAANETDFEDVSFGRTLGQVGMDVRWPFIRPGKNVDIIVEPRAMITQNFGDSKIDQLNYIPNTDGTIAPGLLQDSLEIDFDHNLLWSPNKSTGYDLWQKGFRADVGGSVAALWGKNRASLFVGQSYADGVDDVFELSSGLKTDKSDLVGQFELNLSNKFVFDTRARFDEDTSKFRRLDTGFSLRSGRFNSRVRYYKVDRAVQAEEELSPAEELTGSIGFKITDNWSVKYNASRDLDQDITRRQGISLGYRDDCTLIELVYNKYDFQGDAVRDTDSIGIRVSLLSLGQFGVQEDTSVDGFGN